MSPGTGQRTGRAAAGRRRWRPVRPVDVDRGAERGERAFRVIARRRRLGDRGASLASADRRGCTALLTWALGTVGMKSIGWRSPPWIVSGGRPSSDSKRAPIRVSGSITRCIGRFDSDRSPLIVDSIGWAARMPDISRMVVPELAASSGPGGAAEPAQAAPFDFELVVAGLPDAGPERAHAGQGRGTIGAGRIAADGGDAVGQRAEHRVAVGNRFVARHACPAGHAPRRRHDGGVGRGSHGWQHYSIRNFHLIRFTMVADSRASSARHDSTRLRARRRSASGATSAC